MFLIEIEKVIMKFICKNKRTQIAKAILIRKSEAGGIIIPELEQFYSTIVTKTAWYWHQSRQVDQWYRVEDTETKPHKYSYSYQTKEPKTHNGAGKTGNPYAVK